MEILYVCKDTTAAPVCPAGVALLATLVPWKAGLLCVETCAPITLQFAPQVVALSEKSAKMGYVLHPLV